MAKVSLSNIKTRFETGDRPTGADYVDLIDTLASQATDLGTNGNNENTIYGIENTTVLETLNATQWRLIKYMVSLSKTSNGDNKFYVTEFSILVDNENINVTEFGIVDSDGDIGTVEVSRDGDAIYLTVIPDPAARPITARFARVGLKA